MVDVTAAPTPAATDNAGGSFIGRTRGALRSMRSVLGGGGEYLQGLSNRIGTALSSSVEESDPTQTSPSTQTSQTQAAEARAAKIAAAKAQAAKAAEAAQEEMDAREKLRFPRLYINGFRGMPRYFLFSE